MSARRKAIGAQQDSTAAPTQSHPLAYVADLPDALFNEWLANQQPVKWSAWRDWPLAVRVRVVYVDGVTYSFSGAYGRGT